MSQIRVKREPGLKFPIDNRYASAVFKTIQARHGETYHKQSPFLKKKTPHRLHQARLQRESDKRYAIKHGVAGSLRTAPTSIATMLMRTHGVPSAVSAPSPAAAPGSVSTRVPIFDDAGVPGSVGIKVGEPMDWDAGGIAANLAAKPKRRRLFSLNELARSRRKKSAAAVPVLIPSPSIELEYPAGSMKRATKRRRSKSASLVDLMYPAGSMKKARKRRRSTIELEYPAGSMVPAKKVSKRRKCLPEGNNIYAKTVTFRHPVRKTVVFRRSSKQCPVGRGMY